MKAATILGIGAVTPLGREREAIAAALAAPCADLPSPRAVRDEFLDEPKIAKSLRRADRFVRMAAVAAVDASNNISLERAGLIVVSGFGPHNRGFKFIDGILDCGDAAALPTDFSHSVHNAAASYIAGLLDLRGPTLTATDFQIGFEQAILLAQCWLEQGTCDRVLVGAVEELGDVLKYSAARMMKDAPPLGEGAIFLAMGPEHATGIARIDADASPTHVDLLITAESQIPPEFTPTRTANFTDHFGHSASIPAFQLLGALLTDGFDNAQIFRRLLHSKMPATLSLSKA